MRYSYLQIEKYIADKITSLCEKRDISKYRLSQLSGISQLSLGRIDVYKRQTLHVFL